MADFVIRGGTVVTDSSVSRADIRIEGEIITSVGPELTGSANEIDARGLFVFPGVIDVHLHFNEPGRTEWEGFDTATRATYTMSDPSSCAIDDDSPVMPTSSVIAVPYCAKLRLREAERALPRGRGH